MATTKLATYEEWLNISTPDILAAGLPMRDDRLMGDMYMVFLEQALLCEQVSPGYIDRFCSPEGMRSWVLKSSLEKQHLVWGMWKDAGLPIRTIAELTVLMSESMRRVDPARPPMEIEDVEMLLHVLVENGALPR